MFREFNQPIKIMRKTEGGFQNGMYVDGILEEFTVQTSVQPTWREDLVILPEGRRSEETYTLFCTDKILNENDNLIQKADLAEIYGEIYEVFHVARWQNGIIPHYKAIVIKLAEQE